LDVVEMEYCDCGTEMQFGGYPNRYWYCPECRKKNKYMVIDDGD